MIVPFKWHCHMTPIIIISPGNIGCNASPTSYVPCFLGKFESCPSLNIILLLLFFSSNFCFITMLRLLILQNNKLKSFSTPIYPLISRATVRRLKKCWCDNSYRLQNHILLRHHILNFDHVSEWSAVNLSILHRLQFFNAGELLGQKKNKNV